MKVIDLDNVKFASINNKFAMGKNRLFLNTAYRDFKELIKTACVKAHIDKPYHITIQIEAYQDIDASIKVILDGLQDGGVIEDDKHVHQLTVHKTPIKRGKAGRLVVEVESIV